MSGGKVFLKRDLDMEPVFDPGKVESIIQNHAAKASAVVAILQDIQDNYRHIPRQAFALLSSRLGIPEARIYSVATFYENFSLEPKGRFVIKVCDGTACHVRKSLPILERLRQELKLTAGKVTTADLQFTVETVSCLGACGLAPVITVNEQAYPAMTPAKASELLISLREEVANAKEPE